MLEMTIESIRVSLMNYQRVVILKEKANDRFLPIWIGPAEADAIAVKLQDRGATGHKSEAFDRVSGGWPGSGGAHTGPPSLMAAGTPPRHRISWDLGSSPPDPLRRRRSFDWTSRAKEALLWGNGPEGRASGPPAPTG